MTDRFKEALDCFVGGSWTDEQEQTIIEALTLAQEAEQLRKERDDAKTEKANLERQLDGLRHDINSMYKKVN